MTMNNLADIVNLDINDLTEEFISTYRFFSKNISNVDYNICLRHHGADRVISYITTKNEMICWFKFTSRLNDSIWTTEDFSVIVI